MRATVSSWIKSIDTWTERPEGDLKAVARMIFVAVLALALIVALIMGVWAVAWFLISWVGGLFGWGALAAGGLWALAVGAGWLMEDD